MRHDGAKYNYEKLIVKNNHELQIWKEKQKHQNCIKYSFSNGSARCSSNTSLNYVPVPHIYNVNKFNYETFAYTKSEMFEKVYKKSIYMLK